jgi:hypothetical protein
VLKPGGYYLTQQVGGQNCLEFNYMLEETPTHQYMDFSLEIYIRELQSAGLHVIFTNEAFPKWIFFNIAGVVYYLRAVPWQIPNFSIEKNLDKLYRIHQRVLEEGRLTVREHRFLIKAKRM